MLLISLFITFLLEFFFTPTEDYLQKYGERVAVWFYGKFDTGSKNIAIISWLLILFLSIFFVWLLWKLVVFVHPVLGFVFFIGILFFNLGFKRYLNKFVNISKHLKNGDIELARSALGNWASSVKKDEVLHDVVINGNTQQIARETIKLVVTSLHRNLFGPVFWLCFLPGPVGLVLYKFAMITQQETFRFNQRNNEEKLEVDRVKKKSRFFSPDFDQLVIKTLQSKKFDVVHLESLFTTPYLETIRNHSDAKIVLRSHNLEYMIWQRLAAETNNPAKKIYLNLLSNQLKKYEEDIISKIDGIAAISYEDEKKYKKLGCKAALETIPFGIDTKSYKSVKKTFDKNNLSFFHLGAMNWKPNLEAVGWLNKDIWPTISSAFPNYKLHLAGKNMPQWLINHSSKNIINHREVESAIDFMNKFDIMLVPLLSAGGIRVKIIEGMALGKVIISTKIGAEGIEYQDGVNILIANTDKEFRDKIKWLYSNPNKINEIGENAKKHIMKKYDNDLINKKLIQFYKSI